MTNERIDHAEQAVNFLGGTYYETHGDDDRKVALAQVHATLALVEQQKIANEIAYVTLLECQYAESARHPSQYQWDTHAASIERHGIVLGRIREGLGLS